MFNSRALLAAMLGLGVSASNPPMNILPEAAPTRGKKRRKVDYFRNDVKRKHSGYPGAKLARKAMLGEVGTARPQ